MDADGWKQLQDLFAAGRAVSGEARERILRDARADPEVVEQARALLAFDGEPGIMDALGVHFASMAQVLATPAPSRIGAYRVIGELGRGGMGVVYLADRAGGEFEHRVAIKLIATSDPDDPLHRRFLAERQILAGLIHPNIARLLDGGVTEEGHPYLVMEYIEGVPITTYCDEHRLAIPARLRLFGDVCAAVQHAHQNLVIHRDIKPSNILVSADGRVHLLDFGIAKLITPTLAAAPAPLTRFESRPMTPEYASPEQVRGESLTTASDLYSLGVLLYELLCGCPPYQLGTGSPVEVVTAVCDQDPERPSVRATPSVRAEPSQAAQEAAYLRGTSADRLARQLNGDLDGIVMMAMRKEPGRRYASADMLRQDLERYLNGLPVLAHRGGRRYRLEKFLRRHRVETAAAALVVIALLTGLSIALVQGRRAARERDRAEQALKESDGVTAFLLELFQAGDPADSLPAELTAVDLVKRGAARANDLADQPIVQARLLDVVGQMSLHLGRLNDAERELGQAVAIRRSVLGNSAADLADSLIHLSWVHRTRGDLEKARPLVQEALEIRRKALPPENPAISDGLFELGRVMFTSEQERLFRQARAMLPETAATADRHVTVLQALSTNLRRQGRLAEAVAAGREAMGVAERWFGADHHATGDAMIHLGDHIRDIDQDLATAEQLYRRGLEVMTRHFGENSLRLIHGLNSLATLLGTRGDDEAERLSRRALAISQSATGPEHLRVADQLHKLASELARQGRLTEAETLARQSLDISIRLAGPRHHVVATGRLPLLAAILDQQHRYEDADETYRLAFERVIRPSNVMIGQMHREYGRMLLKRGASARAEPHLLESLALLEEAYSGRVHPNVHESKRALMELYEKLGKSDLVERYRVPPGRFIAY